MTDKDKRRKKQWTTGAILLVVIGIAIMIFCFSSESGFQSNETSGKVTKFLLRLLWPDWEQLHNKSQLYNQVHYYVRKSAHFLEYAALGFFFRLFLYGVNAASVFSFVCTFFSGTVYAALDEYHQFLVDSRSAMWQDALLDSGGVLFGLLIATGVVIYRVKRKAKRLSP